MKAPPPDVEHLVLPSDLFVRCPLALPQVEAHLFIFCLSCLRDDAQRLTFRIMFEHILQDGNAESQYARLEKAQQRLTQPIKYETLRRGKRYSQYIPLFTEMSIDQDTKLITGAFNPHLKEYLWDLSDNYSLIELEALLMLRKAQRPRHF